MRVQALRDRPRADLVRVQEVVHHRGPNAVQLRPRAAVFAHRAVGDAIVVIALAVAFMCLAYFGVEDGIELAADGEDARAAVNVAAASLLLGVLALKIIVLRWWHRMDRYLPALGLTVFTLFAITWWSSAGDYLLGG